MFRTPVPGHQKGVTRQLPHTDPERQIAFATRSEQPSSAIAVCVNFGVFSGREATQAEIDKLAEALLGRVEQVTIVSEIRHEIDSHSEAAVHQVRVEVPEGSYLGREELEDWLIAQAEYWARRCIADRSVGPVQAS